MKIPNYLMTSLAFVGAISLIIMACSADNSNSNTTSNTSALGRYQISSHSLVSSTGVYKKFFDVIDTETGIVKSYQGEIFSSAPYVLVATTVTQ